MRTVCPSCQAAYDVPASVLAAGRTLRCARCGADFTTPAEVAPAETAPVADAPVAAPVQPAFVPSPAERLVPLADKDAPVARTGKRLAVAAGWVISLALLAALAWGFVTRREVVQRAWPASQRLYTLLWIK